MTRLQSTIGMFFCIQLLADLDALDESKHIVDLGAGLTWVDTILRKLGP